MDFSTLLIVALGISALVLGVLMTRAQQRIGYLESDIAMLQVESHKKNTDYAALQSDHTILIGALNIIPKPVLVAKHGGELIFVNKMATELMTSRHSELTHLLGQEFTGAIGSNINALVKVISTQVAIDGIKFKVEHNADAITCVAVLQDITDKANMGDRILTALKSMRNGNLADARIDVKDLSDHHLELATQVNDALGCLHNLIQNTSRFLSLQANAKLDEAPEVTYKGELGYLQYAQILSLNNTASFVTEVNTKALRISHHIHEVNHSIQHVSDRVQQQAAAVAQIASATQNINARSSSLDEQMAIMSKDADATGSQLSDAGDAVNKAGNAMSAIQEKSRKIEEIVSLIDGIAFQTNLLALNAAVEAARAGEHGRGFAVVAGEVRALAGKSADAAKNIKHLIDETISDIRQGGQVFATASASIEKMTHSVAGLTSTIGGMRLGVGETSKGVQEINKGIELMDDSLQQIAALVEETSAASEQANDSANALEVSAGMFSTGLMTQLLAPARNSNDFRFASGRRAIRLWTLDAESYLLGLSKSSSIDQDPLVQWRTTVSEANLSNVNNAVQQLIAFAKKLSEIKQTTALFDEIARLHTLAKATTDAITAEEARVLSGRGNQKPYTAPVGAVVKTGTQAKNRNALPAPARGNKDEWADF